MHPEAMSAAAGVAGKGLGVAGGAIAEGAGTAIGAAAGFLGKLF